MSGALLAQYAEACFRAARDLPPALWVAAEGVRRGPTRPRGVHEARRHGDPWCRQEHGQRHQVLVPGIQGHRAGREPGSPAAAHLAADGFGTQLLDEDGWDPWLEDPASLWLLHWKLLDQTCLAPVWWTAFNLFAPEQFEEHQLTDLVAELTSAAGWKASTSRRSRRTSTACCARSPSGEPVVRRWTTCSTARPGSSV